MSHGRGVPVALGVWVALGLAFGLGLALVRGFVIAGAPPAPPSPAAHVRVILLRGLPARLALDRAERGGLAGTVREIAAAGAVALMHTGAADDLPGAAEATFAAGARAPGLPEPSLDGARPRGWPDLQARIARLRHPVALGQVAAALAARGAAAAYLQTDPAPPGPGVLLVADGSGRVRVDRPGSGRARLSVAEIDVRVRSAADAREQLVALLAELDPSRDRALLLGYGGGWAGDREPEAPVGVAIAWGAGVPAGWLWSPSTRLPGFVLNIDVAPTLWRWLELPGEPAMLGRAFLPSPSADDETAAAGDAVAALLARGERFVSVRGARLSLLRPYVTWQAIAVLVAALFIWRRRSAPTWVYPACLALSAYPLAMLLLPAGGLGAIPAGGLSVAVALYTLTAIGLAGLAWRVAPGGPTPGLLPLAAASWLAVLLDGSLGGVAQLGSALGFSPLGGARFYGIGNEYMGVVVGACAVLTASLRPDAYRLGAPALWGITAVGLALPSAGANLGGGIAAAVGAVSSLRRPLRPATRLDFQARSALVALLVAVVGVAIAADAASSASSHLGLTLRQVASQGWGVLVDVALRKAEMNWRLFRYTIWTWGLLACLIVCLAAIWRQGSPLPAGNGDRPALAAGLTSGVWAALAALLANDSGIVAAATGLIFPASLAVGAWSKNPLTWGRPMLYLVRLLGMGSQAGSKKGG